MTQNSEKKTLMDISLINGVMKIPKSSREFGNLMFTALS